MGQRRNKFDTKTELPETQRQMATSKVKFTVRDLLPFTPMNGAQKRFCESFNEDIDIIVGIGCPGVGKSFLATRLAIEAVLDPSNEYEHVIIIRSAVAVRESGYVPGTIEEKDAMFEAPYRQLFDGMFKFNASYDNLKSLDMITFNTTTYLRGQNFPENSIIILDEIQNYDYSEFCTAFSRTNENSKIILIGDSGQTDIGRRTKEKSGFQQFMKVLNKMQEKNLDKQLIDIVEFSPSDIVRSGIVREFYIAQYELDMV